MSDPYGSDVVLGMHFDGANGSTVFTDSATGKTATPYGGAAISTAQSRFGGASGQFNGTTAYLSIPHSASLSLAGVDYTIECWIYLTGYPADYVSAVLCKDSVYPGTGPSYALYIDQNGFLYSINGNSGNPSTGAQNFSGSFPSVIPLNTWVHVATTRQGTINYGFLNGTNQWITDGANPIIDGGQPLLIGRMDQTGSPWHFPGYIDELRITKGAARYTADFTPPAAPFDYPALSITGVIASVEGMDSCLMTGGIVQILGSLSSTESNDALLLSGFVCHWLGPLIGYGAGISLSMDNSWGMSDWIGGGAAIGLMFDNNPGMDWVGGGPPIGISMNPDMVRPANVSRDWKAGGAEINISMPTDWVGKF